MVLRLKILRQQEQRINKVKNLIDMYSIRVPSIPSYEYQPVGGSTTSLSSNPTTVTNDPKIQATKNLFQMFHADR